MTVQPTRLPVATRMAIRGELRSADGRPAGETTYAIRLLPGGAVHDGRRIDLLTFEGQGAPPQMPITPGVRNAISQAAARDETIPVDGQLNGAISRHLDITHHVRAKAIERIVSPRTGPNLGAELGERLKAMAGADGRIGIWATRAEVEGKVVSPIAEVVRRYHEAVRQTVLEKRPTRDGGTTYVDSGRMVVGPRGVIHLLSTFGDTNQARQVQFDARTLVVMLGADSRPDAHRTLSDALDVNKARADRFQRMRAAGAQKRAGGLGR